MAFNEKAASNHHTELAKQYASEKGEEDKFVNNYELPNLIERAFIAGMNKANEIRENEIVTWERP